MTRGVDPSLLERRLSSIVPTGGNAGEVLTKASTADYDATWAAVPGVSPLFHEGPTTNANSGAFVDLAGIVIPLPAGAAVYWSIIGEFQSTAATSGISFTWNYGAIVANVRPLNIMRMAVAAAGTDAYFDSIGATSSTPSLTVPGAATYYPFMVSGGAYNTGATDGTTQLRFAPEVNLQTATVRTVVGIYYRVN